MSKNSISAWTYFYFVIVGGGEEQLLLDGREAGAVHAGLVPVAPHYAAVVPSQHNTSSVPTEKGLQRKSKKEYLTPRLFSYYDYIKLLPL
jgi:hypothetical protein